MNMMIIEQDSEELLPNEALQSSFDVGPWHVEPDLNRLTQEHSSSIRQLEPRLMHLLCYLAANPDRVLNRDELVNELWPRVIVNENSLTRAISELRKQLAVSSDPRQIYVETIPKKGYRLNPELTQAPAADINMHFSGLIDKQSWFHPKSPLPALSLCLILAGWISMENVQSFSPTIAIPGTPVLLVDVIINDDMDFFGGELTLSNVENLPTVPELSTESIETPIISEDGLRYAYIKYDNTGSTIYVGKLDEMSEATPLYNCNTKLSKLAWSPVGNSLLFASQANFSTAALFSNSQKGASLMMLNLDTMDVSRLLEDDPEPEEDSFMHRNLTYTNSVGSTDTVS